MKSPLSAPPISVVVLTYNRVEDLREQLLRLRRQTLFDRAEIIVVDNHSTDGTEAFLASWPDPVRTLRQSENRGAVGRSAGMAAARGRIVVTLDDDVFLQRDDELERILAFFDAHPAVDAVNFKVIGYDTGELLPIHWFHPRPHERWAEASFETDYISEGAVAFRRHVFGRAGFYPADFFISHEGMDLAWRMINAGLCVYYSGSIAAMHKYSMRERPQWRNAYYNTRNFVWLLAKHEPFPQLAGDLGYRLATTFLFCLRSGHLRWYFKAVRDAAVGFPAQWRKREVLSPAARERLRSIRRFRPGFAYKASNFLLRTRLTKKREAALVSSEIGPAEARVPVVPVAAMKSK